MKIIKEDVNQEPLKVYNEFQLEDKCWRSKTTPEVVLAKSIYYDDIFNTRDSVEELSNGTVSEDEVDKFLSIFRKKGNDLYLPKGTFLTWVDSDNYYRFYKVNDSDIQVGLLREGMNESLDEEIKDDQYKKETEKAKKEAENLIDPMERKNEKAFLGAKKQPEPKKPEEPKATLDESLFEDTNYSIEDIKRWVFESLDNMLEGNGGVEDNLAVVMHSMVNEYNPDWLSDYTSDSIKKTRESYINALMKDLFANAPMDFEDGDIKESLKEDTNDDFLSLVIEWIMEHETAAQDFVNFFRLNSIVDPNEEFITPDHLSQVGASLDDVLAWISEHPLLADDFENYFNVSLDEECRKKDLDEGEYGNKGSAEWQALSGKQSKEDKKFEKGLFARVDNELTAEGGPYELKAPKGRRYINTGLDDKGILVYAPSVEDLDHAKNVAKHFGLKCEINSVPGNQGTKTAYKAVIVIPEDLYEETPEETKVRLAKK